MSDKHRQQIRALLEEQMFAVLSTCQDSGQPYASLLAYYPSVDLTHVVFCTLRTTQKFANLEHDGRVALLVDNRSNDASDLQDASAVTVLGACCEALADERAQLADRFLGRHPTMAGFVQSPDCAVMKLSVRSYYLVTQFQRVVRLEL